MNGNHQPTPDQWRLPDPGRPDPAPIIGSSPLYYEQRESIAVDRYKYIRSSLSGIEEVYDLVNDPGETVSLTHISPGIISNAKALLEQHEEESAAAREELDVMAVPTATPDAETLERLRALGYTQ